MELISAYYAEFRWGFLRNTVTANWPLLRQQRRNLDVLSKENQYLGGSEQGNHCQKHAAFHRLIFALGREKFHRQTIS